MSSSMLLKLNAPTQLYPCLTGLLSIVVKSTNSWFISKLPGMKTNHSLSDVSADWYVGSPDHDSRPHRLDHLHPDESFQEEEALRRRPGASLDKLSLLPR